MAARLVRHVVALAGPAGLFAWWMLGNSPITIGTSAILAVPALVLAAGVLALVARRRRPRVGRERIAALILVAVGAALTAGYWARVWSYRDWDMGGILVGAANIVGFWWPAVAIALAMWTLEEVVVAPGGWPRFRARVVAALLGGIVGAAAFHYGDKVYYERVDRNPLEGERFGWVLDVTDDGTVTLILDNGRGVRTGPVQVRPGGTVDVDGRTVHNVGWLPRSAFPR